MRATSRPTPIQFERFVKERIAELGVTLENFRVGQREKLEAHDGEYEIDVTARFEALGANFLVLIECKCWRRAVARADVQVLMQRLSSLGAQKGMMVSASGFQTGAVRLAEEHGIALMELQDGRLRSIRRDASGGPTPEEVTFDLWLVTEVRPENAEADETGISVHILRRKEGLDLLGESLHLPRGS